MRTKLDGTRRRLRGEFHNTTFNRFDGENRRCFRRVRSEHPEDERDNVIRNGRVLGGLEPTRAFGDARYKWSAQLQEMWVTRPSYILRYFFTLRDAPYRLSQAFMGGEMRRWPGALKTPPYVTAKPEVTHRTLSIPALSPDPASSDGSTLRFLVLATDGASISLSFPAHKPTH